jgi:Spy/CpxP family protein refolding chaperone
MTTLRRLCAAFVLALALALPAFAGDMSTSVVSPPPPPESQVTMQGQMDTGVAGETPNNITGTDPTTDLFLSLLQSLLALF